LSLDEPATGYAVTLEGGNIVVPTVVTAEAAAGASRHEDYAEGK
jgi:hypothetical protein